MSVSTCVVQVYGQCRFASALDAEILGREGA